MNIGVPKEKSIGERRVALIPSSLPALLKEDLSVFIEKGAGEEAGYSDAAYQEKGATIVGDRAELFKKSDLLLMVQGPGADPQGDDDLGYLSEGKGVIAFLDPLSNPHGSKAVAASGAAAFSMEMMPRITRAQSMDALSSMATAAGYQAVLHAALRLPQLFPMLMTAAGTLAPAKVLVIGAGVAGLQAISMARRLGAVVEAYDVRPAVKEQVESLGAKFVELEIESGEAEDGGGYAKALGEDFYMKQRELMARVVKESHVVITTAAIPGKKSPVLVTKEMVAEMQPGSIIVDLAAERGGNCELTVAGEVITANGVTILGPLNLESEVPYHASQMYSKNITTFLLHLLKAGKDAPEGNPFPMDLEDEITRETLITRSGEVVHTRIREILES